MHRLYFFSFLFLILAFPALAQDRTVPQSSTQMQLSFSPIVKRVTPSVVNIYTQHVVQQRMMPFFGDPFFDQMFGGVAEMRPRVENSLGSGVIVRADGLVITNAHVAKNSDKIKIVLSDRREFPAKLVLTDEKSDLALLQIESDKKDFPTLALADSDAIEVGDLVLAIGNPFGVGQTVTSGIVSGLARTNIRSGLGYYIQTDAAINPGNSGGALVNMKGEVIGINSIIISRSGGSMGIGFAIPANLVKTVIASYSSGGKIQRPWLGAALQNVTGDIAESVGLDRPQGVLVQKLYAGGPAEQAGLKQGDIILTVDGRSADNAETIRYILATKNMGQNVPVTYRRQSTTQTTQIKVTAPAQKAEKKLSGNHPLNGATVIEITPAYHEENPDDRIPDTGLVITQVSATAQRLGLRPGDVIVAINGTNVSDMKELQSVLQQTPNGWRIDLLRNGQPIVAMVR